jgi:hypothetical protein
VRGPRRRMARDLLTSRIELGHAGSYAYHQKSPDSVVEEDGGCYDEH